MNEDMNKNELKEKVVDYVSKVFFYCVKRCNSQADAEDLSQTILLEIIQNIDKGARIDNLDYYIWGVCKNQYNMYLRKTIKERNTLELKDEILDLDDSNSVLDEIIEDEKIRRMNQAIKLLSKDYSLILYAYYVEDKTLKFIADELKLPLGTVKWKLTEVRKKLKEYLDMEKLNGKKAYVPKSFGGIMSNEGRLDFHPGDVIAPLLIKNLLYHSYDNPCTLEDYSIELGISIPYVEDYVTRLMDQQFLIKLDNNKYITSIAFIDKDTNRKILDYVKNNIHIINKPIVDFCLKNIDYYRNLLENNIEDNKLLLWSLLFKVITMCGFDVNKHYSKKEKNGSWDFCMAEVSNSFGYDEYFISCNGNKDDNQNVSITTYPASVDNKNYTIGYRISYLNAAGGKENLSVFSKIACNDILYSTLKGKEKEEIDYYLNKNYFKIENDLIKIVPPVISRENERKLYNLIKTDEVLQHAFTEYKTNIYKRVAGLFPSYLQDQLNFIIGAFTNTNRSLVIDYAYNLGLLSLDLDHDYFVYNMMVIKER